MDRRKFLAGAAIAAIGGCQWSSPFDQRERLKIMGLLGAIPPKIISQFESNFALKVEFKAESSPEKVWQELQKNQDSPPQLFSISDAWLDRAIAQSLIQPLSSELLAKSTQWQQLNPLWQQSVTRNNQVWGIPYRWGTTAIAYRADKLKFEITQWSDLWRPELAGKLTLPDDAREVIGIALKKIGQPYQLDNLNADSNIFTKLSQELKSLQAQVLTYSSEYYLQSLLANDSLAAVGWSNDMYRAKRQNPSNLKVVIPQDGTALWSDIWVIPKGVSAIAAAGEWMDFCLTPKIAAQVTALTDAASTSSDLTQVPDSVKTDVIKFLSPELFSKSELIAPLSASALIQYQDLWTKLRSNNL